MKIYSKPKVGDEVVVDGNIRKIRKTWPYEIEYHERRNDSKMTRIRFCTPEEWQKFLDQADRDRRTET